MDAILALGVAADILAVVEFGAGLFALPQSRQGKDDVSRPKKMRKLTEALSSKHASLQRELPPSRSPLLNHELSLLELAASALGVSEVRLQAVESKATQTDARGLVGNTMAKMLDEEEVKHLSQAVSRHVTSILSFRISDLTETIKSLGDVKQYSRPEYESRLDSMSRSVENLRVELQTRSLNSDAGGTLPLTETSIRAMSSQLANVGEAENNILADRIVASLNYASRPARHDSVPQAHKTTFQWAFDSRLSEWFSSGAGTFWVSGKPGSGKSTFMKFIAKHPQTKELLTQWAGSADNLAVAVHFFWIAGTPIQKSWQGLLQSLLFDICHKHPSVVPLISRHRWEAAKAGRWQTAAEPWSVGELAAALRALASSDNIPLKMCFFIDGLDEYDSDHAELCKLLCDLASSPHLKICVSSRPWDVFERTFGGKTKGRLDIHELTRNDIRQFVTDQLQDVHPKSTLLHPGAASESPESSDMSETVEHIVAQANGVFIWAFFVTRSLREDLSSGATLESLQQRLSELPTDLEQLFKHMLESVKPQDYAKMAGTLQAAAHALEPLHIDIYWQLEKEFEEYDYAYRCPIGSGSFEEVFKQREEARNSINEKTKGLLKLVNMRVEFLHRTVKDFALSKDMEEYFRGKLPEGYDGYVSIARAYLGFLKTTPQDSSLVAGIMRHGKGLNSGPFISHLNQALLYACEALHAAQGGRDHYKKTTSLLDYYETATEAMVLSGHVTIRGVNAEVCNPGLPFREELLRHNLTPYIRDKISQTPNFFGIFDESPLFAALTPMSLNSGESPAPVSGTLKLLLQRGEDPNVLTQVRSLDLYEAVSPWAIFARGTMSVFNVLSGPLMFPALRWNDSLCHGLFDLLMSHGADPNAALLDRSGAHTVFSHFLNISASPFLGEECFDWYLRTLDAFFRAGASLEVPQYATTGTDTEAAFGNLARSRPEESVLASYCIEFKSIVTKLATDLARAQFLSSVIKKLIAKCSGGKDDLKLLSSAISKDLPQNVAEPLLLLVDKELEMAREHSQQGTKRHRESWGETASVGIKQARGD